MRTPAMLLIACVACGSDDDEPMIDAGLDASEDAALDADTDAAEDAAVDAPPECFADSFDDPVPGACEARLVDPMATLPVGDDEMGGYIVPGARRVTRVGNTLELPGFPMTIRQIPGTRYAVISDGGVDDEQLSIINIDTLAISDSKPFPERDQTALFFGVATQSDGRHVYLAGGGSNFVFHYPFDPMTGILGARERISFASDPQDGFVSGIALLSDDTTLVVNLMFADALVVYDIETETELTRVPFEDGAKPYDMVISPDESTAFVSFWGRASVAVVDLSTGTLLDEIAVGKNPEGLVLSPDAAQLVVTDSDSDSLSIIDVATSTRVEQLFIEGETAPRGASPAAADFGPDGRLYVVNAGDNAVDVRDPDDYSLIGRIPTMWYPTDVQALDDGTILVLNGKHEGTGANTTPGDTDITELVGGSVTVHPAGSLTDQMLDDFIEEVSDNNTRAARFFDVECPDGNNYDFPIPMPGTGPSPVIRHVILVVRENKTYDAYFGDLTNADGEPHGNGDPDLTLIPSAEIESVIPNTRELALAFSMGDNYYSLAEQSVQGHIWTTWGRTSDFVERSWLSTWGRRYWFVPPQGVTTPIGYPEEGSAFDYLVAEGFEVDNYGEIVSSRSATPNPRYPGFAYNLEVEDVRKAEWVRSRIQDDCVLNDFTYILVPNDHTEGRQPGRPTPRSMIADNDAGVGILADALSHSEYWPNSVMFVIEDDPQDGGDHVDNHRAPLLVISPWVKRGYVSSIHYNEASIYRTIQLILGIEEPLNAYWANAAPMLDMFTSTPDYTPYERIERRWPEETNPDDGSKMARQSAMYDWSRPDEQPGLSRLLWQHLRGTQAPWSISRDELLEALEDEDADSDESGL